MTQFLHFGQILISALSLKQSPVQLKIITIELQLMIICSSIDLSVVKPKVQDLPLSKDNDDQHKINRFKE